MLCAPQSRDYSLYALTHTSGDVVVYVLRIAQRNGRLKEMYGPVPSNHLFFYTIIAIATFFCAAVAVDAPATAPEGKCTRLPLHIAVQPASLLYWLAQTITIPG